MNRTRKSSYWVLGGLLFFCLVYCHQKKFDSPTPVSRLDLLHALWQQHSVCIDAYQTNTPDKAVFNGHYYSDKAPGTVAVALPAFAISTQILKVAKVPLDSKTGWLVSSWITCAGSIALITALGGVALFAWLCHFVSPRSALVSVLALFLGAAPLPYSTMMFSHAMVIGLICIALWALRLGVDDWTTGLQGNKISKLEPRGTKGTENQTTGPQEGTATQPRSDDGSDNAPTLYAPRSARSSRILLAGFCCGLALASEFSCGLIVGALFFWVLFTRQEPASSTEPVTSADQSKIGNLKSKMPALRALLFALAASPILLLIPAYSWACFGTPFTLAYSHQASFPAMKEGIYAIRWPDAVTAWDLLFPPTRGLFFWTPFLLIAGGGYWTLVGKSVRLFLLTYAVPLLHLMVISGRTWDWLAGPVVGPRLLAPTVSLLALPCTLGAQRWPKIGLALAAWSTAITTLATLTDATPSGAVDNPLTELQLPLFLRGEFSPNLGAVLGVPPSASGAVFYLMLVAGAVYLWRSLPKGGV